MAITQQGPDCINRTDNAPATYSIVFQDNPATEEDAIEEIYCWALNEMTGLETGSLVEIDVPSHDEYSCTIGHNCHGANMTSTAGSCNKFESPGDFDTYTASNGEFHALYFGAGLLERHKVGFAGYSYRQSDEIGDGISNDGWTLAPDDAGSCYGKAAEGVGAVAPTSVIYGPLLGPMGGPI